MDHIEWFDVMRMFTATLSLMSMYLLGQKFRKHQKSMTESKIDFWWSINAFLLLLTVASLETIGQDTPFGSRVLLAFLVSVAFFRACWMTRRDPDFFGGNK